MELGFAEQFIEAFEFPPPHAPPFYSFCLCAFCFSFQISLSQTVGLVTVSLQPQGGAELMSLPIY